jgi:hypothetical protein
MVQQLKKYHLGRISTQYPSHRLIVAMTATATDIADFEVIDSPSQMMPDVKAFAPPNAHNSDNELPAKALRSLVKGFKKETTWEETITADLQIAARYMLFLGFALTLAIRAVFTNLLAAVNWRSAEFFSDDHVNDMIHRVTLVLRDSAHRWSLVDEGIIQNRLPALVKRSVRVQPSAPPRPS